MTSLRQPFGGVFLSSALGFVLLAVQPAAQAFVSYVNKAGLPQKWNLASPSGLVHTNVLNRGTRAVRYFLAADAFSSANRVAELNAARACFDQWQAVPGTILRFEEAGLMGGTPDVHTADNTNVVYWVKNSTLVNGGLDNISGATGVAFSDFFSDNTLAEVDIVLNGTQFSWFTDFNNNVNQAQFVEAVLLHEIGHMIGLAHSPVGGATMFPRGGGGVNVQSGLSPDEIAAVRALYPSANLPGLARLSGSVRLGTNRVFGAVVCVEDAAGNIAAGTVTQGDGRYSLLALPPGNYQARVTPVDPANASYSLFRGPDIAPEFATAEHQFLPTANRLVTLTPGQETTADFTVVGGAPTSRAGRLWPPTTNPEIKVVVNYPISVAPGQDNLTVGVYTSDIPGPDVMLRVTGDGLTFGSTTQQLNAFPGVSPPLNLLSVSLSLSATATPGLRSLVVQDANGIAYANGFLEVLPPLPDFNFDGLDDRFQREYFPRWTSAEAAPGADPDGDQYTNADEYAAGSNPADGRSVLRVESVRFDAAGATVTWPSAPGKRYQVLSRPRVDSIRGWQAIGTPVTALGDKAEFLDVLGTAAQQFYRVQALP